MFAVIYQEHWRKIFDYHWENMWQALFLMCEIFDHIAKIVSKHYGYFYNEEEYRKVVDYLDFFKKK